MKNKGKILIVDDNDEILIALKLLLQDYFEIIIIEKTTNNIPHLSAQKDIDLYVLDMNFARGQSSGNEGIYWMRRIIENDPNAIIVFITAYGDIELSVKAMKEGATDFIQKPWDDEKLLATLLSAFKLRKSRLEVQKLKARQGHLNKELAGHYPFHIGDSEKMQAIWKTIEKVAATNANVLILGENGTGKELLAREIHRLSKRGDEIFVKVDVGALSGSLFESELFGHKKGAFTDAREDRIGRFELANGGSVFLDEIANISIGQQSKLLSVLQNREICRIGENRMTPIDIRLICATNKDLGKMFASGEFREDLLYRINTIQIEVPSLRKRKEDIPQFAEIFLKKYQHKYHKNSLTLSKSALSKLSSYAWPGNIRELEHTIEKAVIMSERKTLTADDFNFSGAKAQLEPNLKLAENEKYLIKKAMQRNSGNQSSAAKELGITRKTLYNKLKKYEL
jgi:DNA-binding NtrC family response regulator